MKGSKVGVFGGVCYRAGCYDKADWIPVGVPQIDPDYVNCYYCRACCDRLASGEVEHVKYAERPVIHIVSNVEVYAMDGRTLIGHMAMCLEPLGLPRDVGKIHPVGKDLSRSGPHWDKVTCEPCRERHLEYYR